jgi:transcriptional regulator with XRE-family HTH domain
VDTHVGQKIRARRTFLQMSQSDIADAVGITFQVRRLLGVLFCGDVCLILPINKIVSAAAAAQCRYFRWPIQI